MPGNTVAAMDTLQNRHDEYSERRPRHEGEHGGYGYASEHDARRREHHGGRHQVRTTAGGLFSPAANKAGEQESGNQRIGAKQKNRNE